MRIAFDDLAAIAAECGLAAMGVSSAEPLSQEVPRLSVWQADGCAGEMQYMQRSAEALTSPRAILPQAASVIVFAIPYDPSPHPERPAGFGRVARYAWGEDYHRVLPRLLEDFVQGLRRLVGGVCEVRIATDSVPLLERAVAARGRLGFVGKNTMLIRPQAGSYFFLAEVLTNVEVVGAGLPVVRGRCGPCVRCQSGCPTGAIDREYRVDARRCISYLTIEKRGLLSEQERAMFGEWVFGCDICQEVCPFNHGVHRGRGPLVRPEFHPSRGAGPLLDLGLVLGLRTAAQFESRFGHTPLTRTRRAGLLRNAAIVAANTTALVVLPALLEAATTDPSPTVRLHCAAAMCVLHPALDGAEQRRVRLAVEMLSADPDGEVAGEMRRRLDELV